jgi:hypothetical protein
MLMCGALLTAQTGVDGAAAWGATQTAVAKQQAARLAATTPRANVAVKHTSKKRAQTTYTLRRGVPGGTQLKLDTALREQPVGLPARTVARYVPPVVPAIPAAVAPATYPAYTPLTFTYLGRGGENPYLPKHNMVAEPAPAAPQPFAPAVTSAPAGSASLLSSIAYAIPILPDSGRSILPTVKKVYPTGEKPLVVVSFKCPTELVGVAPPTIQILHQLVNFGMEGINSTNLLSFNLQQVCE